MEYTFHESLDTSLPSMVGELMIHGNRCSSENRKTRTTTDQLIIQKLHLTEIRYTKRLRKKYKDSPTTPTIGHS